MATSAGNLKSASQVLGRIAGYELLEQIGRGGMGVVFRARDLSLGKIVAMKILPDSLARSAEYRARFLREARTLASLDHPSVASCFSVGEGELDPPHLIPSDTADPPAAHKLYLTMEYVPGSDLSALVNHEPLAISRVLDLTGQIATSLEAAHTSGVVHRDLKPANVRVTPDNRVKLLDFGLAAIVPMPDNKTDELVTTHNRVMGTAHFMSPEQTFGRTVDPRSDLFSLGVILYLLVTGRLPFDGKTFGEVEDAIRHSDPPPMARYANGVSDELERITRKLLAKDASDRYQSAHEVRTDLKRLEDGVSKPSFRRAVVLSLCAVLVPIAALVLWQFVRPRPSLAVVPLVNRTGDPRLDYLGDGLASGLVASFIRTSGLSVAPVSSVQQVPLEKRDAKNLKHELGVDAALTGSISKRDDVFHLDFELVEGRSGFVKWAESYDYDLVASIDVERQIVRDVTYRLSGPSLSRQALSPRPTKPRVGSAYDLVLRARSALDDPDDANGPDRALAYLAKALEADPDFALAWACRSLALWNLWDRDKQEQSLRLAEEAANRAVRLNPELLEARLARGQVYRATSRYADAIHELTEVLKANPNWDEAELQLAAAYRQAGDMAKAEAHLRHATDVRPGYWGNWRALGTLLYLRGDYAGARDAFDRVIQLVPEKNVGYTLLAAVEIKTGHYPDASALFDKLPSPVEDGATAANIGTAYFFSHRLEEAGRFYTLATRLNPRDFRVWMNLGDLDARAGRPDSARACYRNALALVDEQLHVDPRNSATHVQRILCLAKLGRCDEAHAAIADAAGTLPADNADLAHQLAKAYALCGPRAEALVAARRAVALGISPALLHDEDEFAALVRDPGFPVATASKTQ